MNSKYLGMPVTICIRSEYCTQFAKFMHSGRKPFYNLSRQAMHAWIRRKVMRVFPRAVICRVHIPAFTVDIDGRTVHAFVYVLRPVYFNDAI